nr:hypothetical protein [Tanacetum cinerariifolium]
MAPLLYRDQRHPWLRYQVEGYIEDIVHNYEQRCETLWGRSVNRFILGLGLRTDEEMAEAGFGAYWLGSERVNPGKGDLRDYWIEISYGSDFLGPAPSYVFIRDHVRRLCHRMISCSIYGRGHAEGRKSRARLSGVTCELQLIDLHEIGRLNICVKVDDTWAWVAPGPRRHPDAASGTLRAIEDAPVVNEGAQADQHLCRHLSHHHLPPGLCRRGLLGSRRRHRSYDIAL